MHIEVRQAKTINSPKRKTVLAPPEEPLSNGDAWSVYGVWAAGVQLMRSLQFKSKASLITALFLMLTILMGWLFVSSGLEQISTAQADANGVCYLKLVSPLTQQLLEVRKQHVITVAGGKEATGLRTARDVVTQQLQKIDAAELIDGVALGTEKSLSELKSAITQVAGASPADAVATFERTGGLRNL